MKTAALLLMARLAFAGFETGAIHRSDGGSFYTNAYPVVARLASGQLLAVWSVTAKGDPDGRIVGTSSGDGGRSWSSPRTVLDIPQMLDADPNILVDGPRVFVYSTTVAMHRTRIDRSQLYAVHSDDNGSTWSDPEEIKLPFEYFVGKRHIGLKLLDGTLAMPFSWDLWAEKGTPARTEGEMDLASGILLSKDGMHWTPFGQIHAWTEKVTPYSTNGLCEPALVQLQSGELLMILRSGTYYHFESRSRDGGMTWDAPRQSSLMGHNTPTALWRLDQHPEEIIAIWDDSPVNRYPLSVAISADGGRTWSKPRDVAISDGPQVSYPGITQASDGTFVAVWQQQLQEGGRDIRWARFTRDWVFATGK